MDLATYLGGFSGLRLAGPGDGAALLAFYNGIPLDGAGIRVRSQRRGDFFRFLDYLAAEHYTIMAEADGAVQGLASVCLRQGYVDGRCARVGYLCDLRLGPRRDLARNWRRAYAGLFDPRSAIDELRDCRGCVAAVIDRGTPPPLGIVNQRPEGLRYRRIAPYRMVNVLGRYAPRQRPAWPVRSAASADLPALREYLDRQQRRRPFGFCYAAGELERRLRTWDGLALEHFLLATAADGQILGCLCPWSPARAKHNVLEHLPWYLRAASRVLPLPRLGAPIRAGYLTHLEISHSLPPAQRLGVFRGLFDAVYRRGADRGWQLLSFCDFESERLRSALSGYVLQTLPMALYEVLTDDANGLPLVSGTAGFEIALA